MNTRNRNDSEQSERVYGETTPGHHFFSTQPQQLTAMRRLRVSGFHLAATVCLLIMASQASAEAWPIPGTGLSLGGYATVSADDRGSLPPRLAIDNASLLLWWQGEGRWKVFSEFDTENVLRSHSPEMDDEPRYLALERLYIDYALSDTSSIRAGKFLTPIGRWNLIHATPLVWTTSRPLVTTEVFPDNVTGLMASGTLTLAGKSVEYSVYGSNGRELRPNPKLDTFDHALGAHLSIPIMTNAQLGVSYASFDQKKRQGERKQLLGADLTWSRDRYEISAEGVYRFTDNGSSWDKKGMFAQLVVPLSDQLYAVGRYESFREANKGAGTQLWISALNYRIRPAVVLKAEWIAGRAQTMGRSTGFVSSLSFLF